MTDEGMEVKGCVDRSRGCVASPVACKGLHQTGLGHHGQPTSPRPGAVSISRTSTSCCGPLLARTLVLVLFIKALVLALVLALFVVLVLVRSFVFIQAFAVVYTLVRALF